ncbi:MAG TPA: discoidin domain-containing protein [Armatimonadota bacterium]|nr:discoidin domain-containing protein [Armatimonadota bacterium]
MGYRPEYATDLDPNTYWGADYAPQSLTVGLGRTWTVRSIRVTNYFADQRFYHYRVEVSTDRTDWTTVGEKLDNDLATAEGDLHVFAPVEARYVRVTMLHNSANIGVHISDVEVGR